MITKLGLAALVGTLTTCAFAAPASAHERGGYHERAYGRWEHERREGYWRRHARVFAPAPYAVPVVPPYAYVPRYRWW
jgi:hypothetical protein